MYAGLVMATRSVWRITWDRRRAAWQLAGPRRHREWFLRKVDAIKAARGMVAGTRAQIVVHRKDGVIQTEWTYTDDPRRYVG